MPVKVKSIEQGYWRHADLPHVELRSTHQSAQPYKTHSHTQLSTGAIEEGVTLVQYLGQERAARAGDIVLIEPSQAHSCNPQENQLRSYHMLYLDTEWCLDRLSAIYQHKIEHLHCDQFIVEDNSLFKTYLLLVQAMLGQRLVELESLLESLSFSILSQYCAPRLAGDEEHEITRYLRRHLVSDLLSPPTLDDLATELACRKETIIRLFKQDTGLPPMAFLNNVRIEKAKSLLRTGTGIAEVATETGYVDQSHFHRAFASYTASTPRQYQQAKFASFSRPSEITL